MKTISQKLLICLGLLCCGVDGCAASNTAVVSSELASEAYRLRPGDELEISVLGHSDMTRKALIREDGTISFSFIGTLPAAGFSLEELEKFILEKLGQTIVPKSESEQEPEPTRKIISTAEVPNEVYPLHAGDELDISVWGHDDLSRKVQVREDGSFSFTLIGNVNALHRSVQEVEKEIQERLDKDYIVNPQVSARLVGAKFSVLGEVERPGSYPLEGSVDLLKALSEAGGLTKSGSSRVEIIRELQDGKITIKGDLERILQGKDPNVIIVPRDTIYMMGQSSETLQVVIRLVGAKFSVLGEVERPGTFPFEGNTDILTAISQAGGITKFGSNHVEIIRTHRNQKVSFRVNLDRILQGQDSNVVILPRDTVYVKRRLF